MCKTTIEFYSGLTTIGGTIVSVQHGNSRVLFDFGLVYSPATNIFDGHIQQRETAMARNYLKLGLLPKIDGVYSQETLINENSVTSASQYDGETAVIISHMHLDHMAAMGFIDPSIPVYMTQDSLHLYNTLETIGEGVPGKRTYQACDYNKEFAIGEIIITPLQVDHDTFGACAFHIRTPDGAILYTGDLRMHGAHPEQIELFIDKAKELEFDAVIIEGTTLSSDEEVPAHLLIANRELPEDLMTEKMVSEKTGAILKETKGIGVFNSYHRNLDRIEGMLQAGKDSGRKVVFEAGTAQIALDLLKVRDFFIYESETIRQAVKTNQLPDWQKKLFEEIPTISYQEINDNPSHYFVQNSYQNSLELFDLNVDGGVYLHSNGVPLGEFDPTYQNLERIMQSLHFERVEVGSGGHAAPQNLKYIVDELNPSTLIPLHSFHPERLKPKDGIQLLPEYGKVYGFSTEGMIEQTLSEDHQTGTPHHTTV
ncbi:MBL fold metallo-hydrolase [Sporosarcina sp. BI001-red]|uniref:MBL fold metallo-hydrolase n=1 Tax=Sporosarcina sp. BI001-red TaxID=2282866 RepID=UPI000E25B168|nr:MBL fold metallo-hydrolase [Sporosarcina sp. BI001-red]REB11021.1 MBL fold metallo-hydrolase [Sporosarcina sp. BI001-red]